jgi:D-lactate dehydrogenase
MSANSTREIDRHSYAHDASHYLLIPQAVATPTSAVEVSALLAQHFQSRVPLTFRSGGTSLSGQSLSDSLLMDSRASFKKIDIKEDGKIITVEPGISVREINNRLKPYGFKFGPDPASEIAATIGGVIANNSSGMVCGTAENAYKTIVSAQIIFSDGSSINTSDPEAEKRLRDIQPELYAVIASQKKRIEDSPVMKAEIERQYRGKNTMGYSLNAFLDYSKPVDILLHIMVGSEGTLAYIAEATFRTIPLKPFAATNLLVFNSLAAANESLTSLVASGAAAIELLDKTSLEVAQREERAMPELKSLSVERHAALIVEYQELSEVKLQERTSELGKVLNSLTLATPAIAAETLSRRNDLWHIRKGLYATVAGARKAGTTALLEDVAVPVGKLAITCESLISLFDKFNYDDSVIFGHAKDGNIHFMLNEDFREQKSQDRYRDFTEEMVDLVLGLDGTLKAEHGTGRVMAPFVRKQFGDDLYSVMVALKNAFDPHGILNPDVIITENPVIHLENYKISPTVDAEIDRCVECGFCEQGCPSKGLTLTPRQRITARRAAESARESGRTSLASKLEKSFSYDGIDTCAVDGMCGISCPVGINTGDLIKRLRDENSNSAQQALWSFAASNWSAFLALSRAGIRIASLLPKFRGVKLQPGRKRIARLSSTPDVIYLPSCTSEIFGPSNNDVFLELCRRAKITVYSPDGMDSICCGTPWKSKGMSRGQKVMQEKNQRLLRTLTELNVPIVTDSSSCTEGFINSFGGRKVMDSTEFIVGHLLSKLKISKVSQLVVHPTCSSAKLDESAGLLAVAHALSENVIVPPNWGCCAFAGDRGLIHPELTASATTEEADFVKSIGAKFHISNNRTCEMAMSAAVGSEYISALQLLHEQSEG